jgi:hypothetical protein
MIRRRFIYLLARARVVGGAAMDAASLTIRARDPASVRHEDGIAVPGLIIVASPARPPHGCGGRGVPRRRG